MTDRMRVPGGAHSPGVWTAGMLGEVYAASDSKWPIAVAMKGSGKHHANARLIAAAPDMLSALEQSRDYVIPAALRWIFDAAIAKAKAP